MSEESDSRLSGPESMPYGLIYRLINKKLGAALRADRAGEHGPAFWNSPELVRFFKRLGSVPQSWPAKRAALHICSAATQAASEAGCSPSEVCRRLTLFCSDGPEAGICGETPRCGECPVSTYCEHPDRKPSIKEWPESERPRERLLRAGEESLSDSELLAIILRGGTRQESALELARKVLSKFGGLRSLARCSVTEMTSIKGIGPAKVAQIKAALGIARRFATEETPVGKRVKGSQQLFEHFHERLRKLKKETFFSILLDTKHRMIAEEQVAVGSLSESVVHPREVFRRAVAESASAVVFVHNHPSGNWDPSPQDRTLTQRLCEAGRLMGIRVLDHLIIGRDGYYSFAENGLIDSSSTDPLT